MVVWMLLLIVFVAGLFGGIINALISDNGFALPRRARPGDGVTILRPGWLGNAFIGGVAAAVSWSLYGPLAGISIIAKSDDGNWPEGDLTLAAIGGAVLVGIGGARWLSNEVDKKLLRAAGSRAATRTTQQASLVEVFTSGNPAAILEASYKAEDDPGNEESDEPKDDPGGKS